MKIVSLSELRAQNIRVARLAANRELNKKAVAAKVKSMREYGQEVPAIIVNGTDALAEGLKILDFETGHTVTPEEAQNYVVLTDGNHRYQAFLNLTGDTETPYTDEFTFMFPLSKKGGIAKMLAEINTCTNPWKGADFVKGAIMTSKTEIPVLEFIHKLTSKGYSLPSASQWANGGKLTAKDMTQIMNGQTCERLAANEDLPSRMVVHAAACERLGDDMLKARTISDWVIAQMTTAPLNQKAGVNAKLKSFFEGLTDEQVTDLKAIRGTRGGETRESLLNKQLTELYTEFCKSKAKELCN